MSPAAGPAEAQRKAPRMARGRWLASWRSAIRLAWRDARRHRAGSLLIMAMIGLPVLIISAGAAVVATTDVTPRESLPVAVGRAQALVTTHPSVVVQSADGREVAQSEQLAPSPVPGRKPGDPWTPAQLEQLTGGRVGPSETTVLVVRHDSRSRQTPARVIGREVLPESGLATLLEGRWPERPDEVLVTEVGIAGGLPRTGAVEIATARQTAVGEIVGVVAATGPDFSPVSLIVGPEWLDAEDATSFLLFRDAPVTWTDIQAWNAAGLSVLSPAVIADPSAGGPPSTESCSICWPLRFDGGNALIVMLLSLGLVFETALLAGPAFAVSAARRRRSLALIASNGPTRSQVVRYVTAQGVVLGGVAVLVGALLGTAAGWSGVRLLAAIFDQSRVTTIGRPPLDTYGWSVAMVTLVAFVAGVLSALVPGVRLAGDDIAGELAERPRRGRIRRGLPIAGAVIMVAGALLVGFSLTHRGAPTSMLAAGIGGSLLVLGALFELPLVIERVGRWATHAPAAARIGMRDVARTPSRSLPAVAAITVAVAVLTMITIPTLSEDAQARHRYLPSTMPGAAVVVDAYYGPRQATLDEVRTQHPSWSIQPSGVVGDEEPSGRKVRVSAVPPGCTPEQAIRRWSGEGQPPACQAHGSDNGWRISVPAANTLNAAVLSAAQLQAFERGTMLVTSPDLLRNGTVRVAVTADGSGSAPTAGLRRTVEVPAMLITMEQAYALDYIGYAPDPSYDSAGSAIISAAGAEQAGLPWMTTGYEIIDPAGPISRADERAINDRVAVPISVERGYQSANELIWIVLLSIAVALALVASLISTALTQVEARAQSATLAAMGASGGVRRRVAGTQAITITAIGTVLGVLLGVAPGLALTAASSWGSTYPGSVFVVPYARFGLLIIGVPLLAAGLATLMVRRDPVLTRRPT